MVVVVEEEGDGGVGEKASRTDPLRSQMRVDLAAQRWQTKAPSSLGSHYTGLEMSSEGCTLAGSGSGVLPSTDLILLKGCPATKNTTHTHTQSNARSCSSYWEV